MRPKAARPGQYRLPGSRRAPEPYQSRRFGGLFWAMTPASGWGT